MAKDRNPYQAPKSRVTSRAGTTLGAFAPSGLRAQVAVVLLGISLAIGWGARGIEIAFVDEFATGGVPPGVSAVYGVLTSLAQIVRVAGIVAYLVWVYRIAKNARALPGPAIWVTPGWAVGYHLIPIANLWMPYSIMKLLGEHSGVAQTRIQIWWGTFVGALASTVVLRSLGDDTRHLIVRLLVTQALLSGALFYLWQMMKDFGVAQGAHQERAARRAELDAVASADADADVDADADADEDEDED